MNSQNVDERLKSEKKINQLEAELTSVRNELKTMNAKMLSERQEYEKKLISPKPQGKNNISPEVKKEQMSEKEIA